MFYLHTESGESNYSSVRDSEVGGKYEKSEKSVIFGSRHPTILEEDVVSSEDSPDLTEVTVLGKAINRKKYGDFLVKFGKYQIGFQSSIDLLFHA